MQRIQSHQFTLYSIRAICHNLHQCHFSIQNSSLIPQKIQITVIIKRLQYNRYSWRHRKTMGNQASFCCDHNVELDLFESDKRKILSVEQEDIKDSKGELRFRNQKIFSKDDISIIDQLDTRSEFYKDDFLSLKRKPNKETARVIDEILTERQNYRMQSETLESEKKLSSQRQQKWLEYKFKELEQAKKKQKATIRKELENEYKAKNNLKDRNSSKEEKVERTRKNNYDFQFIVNYRN